MNEEIDGPFFLFSTALLWLNTELPSFRFPTAGRVGCWQNVKPHPLPFLRLTSFLSGHSRLRSKTKEWIKQNKTLDVSRDGCESWLHQMLC